MNELKLIIDNTRELYDKQVEIANMIVNGNLTANEDAIKRLPLFREMIIRGKHLVWKSGDNVSIEDIDETKNATADYILNELVPFFKKKQNKA